MQTMRCSRCRCRFVPPDGYALKRCPRCAGASGRDTRERLGFRASRNHVDDFEIVVAEPVPRVTAEDFAALEASASEADAVQARIDARAAERAVPHTAEQAPSLERAPSPEPAQDRNDRLLELAGGGEGLYTALLVGDLHGEERDPDAWSCLLSWLRRNPVDEIVLGGDVGNWRSCSRHGDAIGTLAEDARATRGAVDSLLAAARQPVRLVILEGNHDRWPARLLATMPAVRDSIPDWSDGLGATWIGERQQPYALGTLDILHGHQFLGGERWRQKYPCARAIELYGRPGREVVFFHTHKHQHLEASNHSGQIAATNLPGMAISQPHYCQSPSGHVQGWGVAYLQQGQPTHLETVRVLGGRAWWGGELYR